MKKLLSCLLALACVLSMSVPVFAAESDIEIIDVNPENIVLVEDVIGSLNDQDGILLDDEPTAAPRKVGFLFTMTATKVYELLTTYGANKNFTGGCMDGLKGEGLLITGTVTNHQPNVVEGAATVKVGGSYKTFTPAFSGEGVTVEKWLVSDENGDISADIENYTIKYDGEKFKLKVAQNYNLIGTVLIVQVVGSDGSTAEVSVEVI